MENKVEFELLQMFPSALRFVLSSIPFEEIYEIRLRIGQPLIVYWRDQESVFSSISECIFFDTLNSLADYSLYMFEEERKQGFFTIPGGHRVGIGGRVVLSGAEIQNLSHISFMNIRICHEQKGIGEALLEDLLDGNRVVNTLLISPPGQGKTTLLRDLIRIISNGNERIKGRSVGVVDERSEIGGCYRGIPQNDIGIRTDILDACPKALGMRLLLRSMSPQIIAVDEIGSSQDKDAIEEALCCGCTVLATAHGNCLEDIRKNPCFHSLINEQRFERYIFLLRREGKRYASIYSASGEEIREVLLEAGT